MTALHGVWVEEGNDPDYATLAKHGIDLACFSIRDPRVTAAYLRAVLARPEINAVEVYAAWNWDEVKGMTGAKFADWVNDKLTGILVGDPGPVSPSFPRVGINIEVHDPAYVVSCFKRWRAHRQNRITAWSLEGMQGGLFEDPDVVQAILHADVLVVPEFYRAAMLPQHPGVTQDLLMSGFPGSVLKGFYNAADLPFRWDGYAFSMGTLPR